MPDQGETAAGEWQQMKILLQEKIAELEQRIVRLEEQAKRSAASYSRISVSSGGVPSERMRHWHKMWEEFNLAMKEMFE